MPTFDPKGEPWPGVRLDGPGLGEVVLVSIETRGDAGFQYSRAGAGIAGEGFEELRIVDCNIESASIPGSLTGLGYGASGVDVSVPFVWIERSAIKGSKTDIDATPVNWAPAGAPGLKSTGEVVVLDSTITAGENGEYYWNSGGGPPCPTGCPSGAGAPAVRCDTLYWANSFFIPAAGAKWSASTNGNPKCCQVPAPAPLDVQVEVPLVGGLKMDLPASLGDPFRLSWSTGGNQVWLIGSAGIEPARVYGFGIWFLGRLSSVNYRSFSTPGDYTVVLPADPALVGRELGFQVYDPAIGLTRPVVVVARP